MKKFLLFVLSVMTGFIFVVLFIKCIGWAVTGVKLLIEKVKTGNEALKIKINEEKQKRRELREAKRAERMAKRQQKQAEKVDLVVDVNETTGA